MDGVQISVLYQTASPFISFSFFQMGGLAIGFILFNPVQLIGLINVFLGITIFIIVYIDVKKYPHIYAYEKIRRKRKEVQKRRKKEKKESRTNHVQEIIE